LSVIHLKRKNILKTLVSHKIAFSSGAWRVIRGDSPDVPVSFSIDELTVGFEQTRVWEAKGDSMFENHRTHTVFYEELVGNRDVVYPQILDFLGCPRHMPTTNLRQQSYRSLRQSVSNYDELKDHFSSTEWGIFFED
jgi:LPS sulfotransferase NodH